MIKLLFQLLFSISQSVLPGYTMAQEIFIPPGVDWKDALTVELVLGFGGMERQTFPLTLSI